MFDLPPTVELAPLSNKYPWSISRIQFESQRGALIRIFWRLGQIQCCDVG